MQKLIVSNDRECFEGRVNKLLEEGATVVPGTLDMLMVRTANGRCHEHYRERYAALLELREDS